FMELEALRHSCAHLLASAIKELYPDAKMAIGPAIEDGFYYDFDNINISEKDLPKIESKMQEIANKKLNFEKTLMTRKEAEKFLKDQQYKLELLKDIPGEKVQFYKHGNYYDLCKGGHLKNTSEIKAFKLTKIAQAYWKGDSKNKQLTRIYGTAWTSKDELNSYLKKLEEADKRDHRKLGKELELFMFNEISPGAPFWLPNGMIIFKELEKYWREIHDNNGYNEINTPIVVKESLFKKSGHLEHYKENMFPLNFEKENYYLKPMNCPEATLVYSSKLRSYKDLPIRLSEIGRLFRNELSGALGGLFRVRQLTMDDAHIFCTENQIQEEITNVLSLVNKFYSTFNFKPNFYLATRPEKALGDKKIWNIAEKALENSLKLNKVKYEVKEKDGAFYGPKIDIHIKDSLNRDWQLATIQLDFQMPQRFELSYEGKDGKKHTPVMIHRAIFGSFERFIGILIEHFSGKFPLWLSPVQVIVMNVNQDNLKFSNEVVRKLKENNIRVEIDDRNESIPRKVRESQLRKIPYAITIGDKEVKNRTLAVRTLDGKVKFDVKLDSFIKNILKEIRDKEIK
ncbi:MAG: threonine--tRNA ligase, partial [Nanoarchaeota archaeon]